MGNLNHSVWEQKAGAVQLRTQALINGKYADTRSGKTFDCINPATMKSIAHISSCDEEDANLAVAAEQNAFDRVVWSRQTLADVKQSYSRLLASSGTASVNTVDALSPMTPFVSFKQSGFRRYLSLHAFDKYTALKTTWIKY